MQLWGIWGCRLPTQTGNDPAQKGGKEATYSAAAAGSCNTSRPIIKHLMMFIIAKHSLGCVAPRTVLCTWNPKSSLLAFYQNKGVYPCFIYLFCILPSGRLEVAP